MPCPGPGAPRPVRPRKPAENAAESAIAAVGPKPRKEAIRREVSQRRSSRHTGAGHNKTGPARWRGTRKNFRTPVGRSVQPARTSPNAGRLHDGTGVPKTQSRVRVAAPPKSGGFACRAATLANSTSSRLYSCTSRTAGFRFSKLAGREDGALSLDGARTLDRTPLHRLAQIRCSSGDAPSDLFGGPPPPPVLLSSPCAMT